MEGDLALNRFELSNIELSFCDCSSFIKGHYPDLRQGFKDIPTFDEEPSSRSFEECTKGRNGC